MIGNVIKNVLKNKKVQTCLLGAAVSIVSGFIGGMVDTKVKKELMESGCSKNTSIKVSRTVGILTTISIFSIGYVLILLKEYSFLHNGFLSQKKTISKLTSLNERIIDIADYFKACSDDVRTSLAAIEHVISSTGDISDIKDVLATACTNPDLWEAVS